MQTPSHTPLPGGQKHTPPTHCSPEAHRRPQLPQLSASDASVTQAPLQLAVGEVQLATHLPAWHSCPAPHTTPHPPQLEGSDCVETQRLAQREKPLRHWQRPWSQPLEPGPQLLPQAPQLTMERLVSVQAPLQLSRKPHCAWQLPKMQASFAAQGWLQPPQWAGSLPIRTQLPLQRV
jgi:hypothetical protein